MTRCYICTNDATHSSGLCDECLRGAWQHHVRANIPPENMEHWAHKEPDVWFWGGKEDGLGERWLVAPASVFDEGYPREFISWTRPEHRAPAPPVDDLSADLVAIVAAQAAEIAQLRDNKALLEQIIAQERSASGRLLFQN